jgi:hypothetical protein
MGTDIHGWVEVVQELDTGPRWVGVIRIKDIIFRTYGVFGCLFGVLNADEFDPVAAGRGIPKDASIQVYADGGDPSDPAPWASWALWGELDNVNWDERGARAWPDEAGVMHTRTRREMMDPAWELLFQMMAALATRWGEDGVRLVAWFDW